MDIMEVGSGKKPLLQLGMGQRTTSICLSVRGKCQRNN